MSKDKTVTTKTASNQPLAGIKYVPSRGKYLMQWQVKSDSIPSKYYTISVNNKGGFECSCPGWTRHVPRKDCKHITRVKQLLSLEMVSPGELAIAKHSAMIATVPAHYTELMKTNEVGFPVKVAIQNESDVPVTVQCVLFVPENDVARTAFKNKTVETLPLSDRVIIDDNGDPLCPKCSPAAVKMEARWGCWTCNKCGFTISEEDYFEALKKQPTPERRYPV